MTAPNIQGTNVVVMQFNGLQDRDDVGALWENFIFCERLKKLSYENIYGYTFFWRTYGGDEIDLVEERDGIQGLACVCKKYGVTCHKI